MDLDHPPFDIPSELPHEALGNRIAELSAHLNAAKYRLLALIAEFDRRGGWADEGALSCAHWLNWKCGVSMVAAREQVRVARALEELPRTCEAFSRGEISYSKVRALSRVATPESESYFLMIAEHGTAAHLEVVVRGVRRARREKALREANERHERRGVSWRIDDDGSIVLTVRLDAEQGERALAALDAMVARMREERDDSLAAPDWEVAGAEEPDYAARRADALLRLLDGPNPDTEMVVHVAAETLIDDADDGCCELAHGTGLPAESARRLGCDAGIVRLLVDPEGQPLDVGRRTRSIPPALKRALEARDGGCRFPGCSATAHVEGHHVRHWAHGGETSLSNLLLVCRFHHRLVHEGGFSVEHAGEGRFRFRRPDGKLLEETIPRKRIEGDAEAWLFERNRAHGLVIDHRTGVTKWDGWPMDHVQAVEGGLQAGGELEW